MLELWISGTIDECAAAVNTGLVTTIATNPTLIRRWTEGGRSLEAAVSEMCSKVHIPVYVQLYGGDVERYVDEYEALHTLSEQIQPALVATQEGIIAASRFARHRLKPLVTAITTVNQAYLAALAGATYIAPDVARIQDGGEDSFLLIDDIATLYSENAVETKIIATGIRTPDQAEAALNAGAHALNVSYEVFQKLYESRLTQQMIDSYARDWAATSYDYEQHD